MKKLLFILIFYTFIQNIYSQDTKYAHYLIDSLCSPSLYGRAYTNNGDKTASTLIAGEFAKNKINYFNNSYFQDYFLTINSFSKELSVETNKKQLEAGSDFLVSLSSPTVKGKFKVFKIDSNNLRSKADIEKILKRDWKNKIILVDKQNINDKAVIEFINSLKNKNPFLSAGLAFISDSKLMWGTSDGKKQNEYFKITIKRSALPKKIKKIKLNIEAEFLKDYKTSNVIGYIKGKLYPDSFYVFTAHYDHLGQMGKNIFFPGANDNASGTAMVMDLARYFSTDTIRKPDYSIVFALVSGEECGLEGSHFLANHPLFPLENIKFLINLDMVGTGSEGITIVNGTKFEEQFNKFEKINNNQKYLKTIAKRGESCNSDHCAFYEKGVPSIFIYAMGSEFTEYHNIYDIPQKIPLTKYNEIFRLLVDYVTSK